MVRFSKVKLIAAVAGAALFSLGIAACDSSAEIKSTELGKAAAATALSQSERNSDGYKSIAGSAEAFAAKFASTVYSSAGADGNLAVSPVSVYMAMSLAAQCADGDTRTQITDALGISYEDLLSQFSFLYRSLVYSDYDDNGSMSSASELSDSIWVDCGLGVNDSCISDLSDKFYCYSYSADFSGDNSAANNDIRNFVKDKTHGLIDRDFGLSGDTLFTLINTLYLKDVWNSAGSDLSYTAEEYGFTCTDGSVTDKNLLCGYYNSGRARSADGFTTFYTTTERGYKIKFIVPEDGYTLADVFTAENIAYVNSITDYNSVDEEAKVIYNTRCLFPEFTAEYDGNVKDILMDYGITDLFDGDLCNMSTLTSGNVYCSQVRHVTRLEVNKTGIEGAAVTVLVGDPPLHKMKNTA